MRSKAPKQYLDQLIPKYREFHGITIPASSQVLFSAIGCKRLLFDTDYLAALHRPNLTLNSDGIETIVEDGIVTTKGRCELVCTL
jgi:hypothetical protein